MINQDSAHQLGCNSEKMSALLPLHPFLIDESNVGLIYQCSGLERMSHPLSPQIARCLTSQLVINDGHELIQCLFVAIAPSQQQLRYIWLRIRHFEGRLRQSVVRTEPKSGSLCFVDVGR